MVNKNIKISKLDAAKRQLETAIRLYFNDADPISVHTLACAAHGILSDINKKHGGRPMIVSDSRVMDEYKKKVRQKLLEAKNHFKHANNDPDAVIDFNPEVNEYFILDACIKYKELTGEFAPYLIIFWGWFVSGNLRMFSSEPWVMEHAKIRQEFKSKADYFSKMLSVSGFLK